MIGLTITYGGVFTATGTYNQRSVEMRPDRGRGRAALAHWAHRHGGGPRELANAIERGRLVSA